MSMGKQRSSVVENVRMGPLSIFTLVSIVCLAVLAVLATSTANATMAMSQRRSDATTQLYIDEVAAQTFMATLDAQLVQGADDSTAIRIARDAARASAPEGTELQIDASLDDEGYHASFDCGNGRELDITLQVNKDGSLDVRTWRMTAVVNDEPTMGNLFGAS